MAKKSAKKKPSSRKPAAKGKKSAAKKPAIPGSPKAVSTGKGPGAREVGEALVKQFNKGQWGLNDKLWAREIVCVEGVGMAWSGRKNVDAKNADWNSQHKVHGGAAEGPYVGATGFAVKFRIDVEVIATQQRMIMEEVGVYTVKNGKIVREEFMYGSMLPVSAAAPTTHLEPQIAHFQG